MRRDREKGRREGGKRNREEKGWKWGREQGYSEERREEREKEEEGGKRSSKEEQKDHHRQRRKRDTNILEEVDLPDAVMTKLKSTSELTPTALRATAVTLYTSFGTKSHSSNLVSDPELVMRDSI